MRIETKPLIARMLGVAPGEDESAATAALGPDHELARLLTRRRTLVRQLAITSLTLSAAALATVLHAGDAGIVLVAAAAVELVLAAAFLYCRSRTRDVSQELIAAGEDAAFSVRAVRREGRRLVSRRERERFAGSLEHMLHDSEYWHRIRPASRPLDGTQFLRFAASEAREVVALLRAEAVHVRGVALMARFLMDGVSSPLYAGDAARIREELRRIRYLLTPADSSLATRAAA
jgi:hypothetical protein